MYRNETTQARISVRLRGKAANTQGVGARISVTVPGLPEQSQEMIAGGRYLSGDDYCRTFAAGNSGGEALVRVKWRTGRISEARAVPHNTLLQVVEE